MKYNSDIETDLKDLFFYFLKYWYVLVLSLLIGGIIGGSYATYKNHAIYAVSQEARLAAINEVLTPDEKKVVDDIMYKIELAKEKKDMYFANMTNFTYSGDDLEDAIRLVDYWTTIYNQQTTLSNLLEGNQQTYFQLLTTPEKVYEKEKISTVKFIVIGAGFLFVLSFLFLLCKYLFTPTIKVPGDLFSMYHYPLLMNISETDCNESMLSTDITILMSNASLSRLAILCDDTEKNEADSAKKLVDALKEKSPDIYASVINPLSSPEELQKLSGCDSVVSLVTIKKTLRPRLYKSLSYCDRYGCNILGFVTLG